ncbi:histidine phosphatase family protein [Deinococcus aluminii]|uniref:Histidine phosphatase family protein n=1 Tax=Deinococcus aluminii TaxID=1656885 RepID=A0ABP9XEK6_9DEIO
MARTLHLIKHARPRIVPGVPAHDWPLAPGALDGIPALAARLVPPPELVVSSEEGKAKATAQALAARLGVPCRSMLGLHEQLRYTVPYRENAADFQADLRRFFLHPAELVFGEESADDARTRFAHAVQAVMLAHTQERVAIVAHGTVISLLIAGANGLDPLPLWTSLGLLEALTVDWPGLRLRAEA